MNSQTLCACYDMTAAHLHPGVVGRQLQRGGVDDAAKRFLLPRRQRRDALGLQAAVLPRLLLLRRRRFHEAGAAGSKSLPHIREPNLS